MTDDRRMTTDRFYGGVSNRLENLRSMLNYIHDENISRDELNQWVIDNTQAGSADAVSHHLTFLDSIGIIELSDTRCRVGEYGRKWLANKEPRTLYEAFTSGVKGFDTILRELQDDSMTDEDIMDLLVQEFEEAEMSEPGPAVRHREWLQVLGYIKRKYGVNRITEEGDELVESLTGDTSVDHSLRHTPPEEVSIGDELSQEKIEEVFDTEFGYRISGINPRRDSQDNRYVLLFANEDGPYDDAVKQGRFEYVGEGLNGDQDESSPGNSALIDSIESDIPVHFFYQQSNDGRWEYRGIIDIVDYEYREREDREVLVFEMEYKENTGEISWLEAVRRELEQYRENHDTVVTLNEIYNFSEENLESLFPNNDNVKAKIRQQLQILRDKDELEFLDGGSTYQIKTDDEADQQKTTHRELSSNPGSSEGSEMTSTGDYREANKLLEKVKNDSFDVHSDFDKVMSLLKSKNVGARKEAALCFEKLAEKYPIEVRSRKSHIKGRLKDEHTAVRAEALSALNKLAEEHPEAVREDVPDIIDRIQDKPYVKKTALNTVLTIAQQYPEDVHEHVPELIEEVEGDKEAICELAAKAIVEVTSDGDSEVLQDAMDRAKEDGAAKEILQESLTKVNRDDGSTSDDDEDDSDEDGLAYQEASSIELPKEYEFKRRVEENDYFNILLDPSEEGIRVTLKLVDKGTRQPNYCRALSNDEIYVPMHIFAALGLHDNQIDWIGSNGQQEVILGRLKRPSIQPEVPEAEQLEVSNINPSDKRSDKGFDIKIDLENGHKPEAMYLDVLEIEGYLGISAMPVELDDTTRDLPNVSANTSQTKNTLQFRIPVSIVNALGLDDVNEFRWFTQGESISLILADDKSFTEKAQEDDEGKSTIDYTEYENIDSLLADLENRTLASQREIIRKRVLNPDIGLESIVNSPDVDVTGKIVKETLDEYGEIIQHFASSDTNDVSEREGVGDSKLEDYVDENDRETVHDEKSHSLSNKENTNGENNREKLLNSIEKVHEELGKIPTIEDIEEKTTYSRKDYYEYFGSWIEALDEAGYNYKNANRNDPTEEELLNGIREVGQKLGERPTQADMEEVSPYTSSDYKAQFDNPSWTTALEKVGYEFSRGTNTDKQIEEELLDAIQCAYEKLGRKPTAKDVYDMFSYSRGEYQAAFGSWITALEEAGYEYESGNRDINQTGPRSGNKKHDQESEKILEFSKEGARMKEVVQKPLTGGRKEVTIEKVDESSFPIDNLYLHVNSVDVDEKGNNVRLQFEQTSDTELDTKYLLEFTGGRAELKEITEKVFGEGTNEVTIETIDWDQEVTDTIDMQVAEIRLQNGDPSRPTLSLSSIDKQN